MSQLHGEFITALNVSRVTHTAIQVFNKVQIGRNEYLETIQNMLFF